MNEEKKKRRRRRRRRKEEEEEGAPAACDPPESGREAAEFAGHRRTKLQERIREANRFSLLCPPR